jgi:hypothetical protein
VRSLAALALLLVVALAAADEPKPALAPAPVNLDFEEGPADGVTGWKTDPKARFAPDATKAHAGKRSLRFAPDADQPASAMYQTFDATPYRGKRVRFSVRVTGIPVRRVTLQSWSGDLFAGGPFWSDAVPLKGEWAVREIVFDVGERAADVTVALGYEGDGEFAGWVDDARVEVVPDATPLEPPLPRIRPRFSNLDFDVVRNAQAYPADWNTEPSADDDFDPGEDYTPTARVDREVFASGSASLQPDRGCILFQDLDAAPYVGKRVEVSVRVRWSAKPQVDPVLTLYAWAGEKGRGGSAGKIAAQVVVDGWETWTVALDVPAGTKVLRLRLGHLTDAKVWFDGATFRVVP